MLHEAFDAGKWHLSSIVKAIISGDQVPVNVKSGKMFDMEITAPIFWGANTDPQFKEATRAITNRIVVIECRREFDEKHPVGAALEAQRLGFKKPSVMVLAQEAEGVLAWAMEGLRRLLARGHFVLHGVGRGRRKRPARQQHRRRVHPRNASSWTPTDGARRRILPPRSPRGGSRTRARIEARRPARGSGRAAGAWRTPDRGRPHRIAHQIAPLLCRARPQCRGRRHWRNTVTSNAFVFQGRTTSTSDAGPEPEPDDSGRLGGQKIDRSYACSA